jgi:aminopeptidase N
VLKQLVSALGDTVFLGGLRDYFERHAFGNAEFADLLAAWTRAGAVGLDHWAQQWLRTSGMDRIEVDRSGGSARVTRTPPMEVPADRTHAVTVASYNASGELLSSSGAAVGRQPVQVDLPSGTALVVPDAADSSWARIRFGDWSSALATLPLLSDSASRVVVLNAVRDAVRSAELNPAVALDALCTAARSEDSDVVLRSVLQFAQDQLAGPYAPPAERVRRTQLVNAAADDIVAASESGSDRQLAAFRIAIRSSDDADELHRWLRSELPTGVSLDPELSWAMVERLAILTADAELIEKALRDDPSASAEAHAARARAGLPTAAAKDAAWELLMRPSTTGAYELYATAEGFFVPTQVELTRPFVSAYFAEIADTARFRTGWALGQVALLSYPSSASTRSALELADRTLAETDLAPAVRRSLVDGTDRLRRAVSSLESFGG